MADLLNFVIVSVLCLLGGNQVTIPSLTLDPIDVVNAHRRHMLDTVFPWYYENSVNSTFQGVEDVSIFYRIFRSPTPNNEAIIFLHGNAGQMAKYAEFLFDLRQLQPGYDIYIMDHRGHGNSGRLLDNPLKIYVKSFEDYVKDVRTFYDTIVTADINYEEIFMWGHSMGGGIAVDFAEQYPSDLSGLLLSNPMMQILTKTPLADDVVVQVDEDLAFSITCQMTLLGMGKCTALGQDIPRIVPNPASQEDWERSTSTTSWKRWRVFQEFLEQNPHLIAGGAGISWGNTNRIGRETYAASFRIRNRKNAEKLVVPILLLQADMDLVIANEGHAILKENAVNVPYFEIVRFPDAYHDVFVEKDVIRNGVLSNVSAFLDRF